MSYAWWTNVEAYKWKQKRKVPLVREKVEDHPLMNTLTKLKTDPFEGIDPLTINLNELDPLTRMAVTENETSPLVSTRSKRDSFEPWNVRKNAILSKFTAQEKLSIITSTFSSEADVRGVSEKILHRLEQLDVDGGSKQYFGGLTQEEYISKINQLNIQLCEAWQSDLRVNALKIAIQCSKFLGDTTCVSFYPSKFVIITDILDKFGTMVYTRLKGKQSETVPPEVAKETCKNWFFKVGSIRELLPRLCIELAILKSYSFISQTPEFGRILIRLLNSMWGIGDPVVAIYMRCYLCRVAMDLVPDDRELYMKCFQDLLLLHDQMLDNFRHSKHLIEAKVTMDQYMSILSPAVDFILQCLVYKGEHLKYTLQLVSNVPPFLKSVLLSSVLSTFPPAFIEEECLNILEMICGLEFNVGEILNNLGHCLILNDSHHPQSREIWPKILSQIRKIRNKDSYLNCCVIWMEFVVKNFGNDVIKSFLEEIISEVSLKNIESYQPKFKNIIEKLVTFSSDIVSLLKMNIFVKILTTLPVDIIKTVLTAFNSKHTVIKNDNILVSTIMHLATSLHDSVDALTSMDEVKQIGGILNGFIMRVTYEQDFEKQLQFYDEARGAFTNIDAVLVLLIQCVLRLGMEVSYVVKGHHTKRTRGFLSACIAYSFITVPSLENLYTQLQLYHLTSQVAYANHCLSQGDACLKATINLLNDCHQDIECGEVLLVEFSLNLLSSLLAVPDHPKESTLYMLKAFMNVPITSVNIQLKSLSLLGAYAQSSYLYCFPGVEGNWELYGGSNEYLNEINSLGATLLNEILTTLKTLGDQNQTKAQGKLALNLFWEILNWGDLNQMGSLAVNLWKLSKRHSDSISITKSYAAVQRREDTNQGFQLLASKLASIET